MFAFKILIVIVMFMPHPTNHFTPPDDSSEFSVEESRPLLETLSKLYPISAARCSAAAYYGSLPHFCFLLKRSERRAVDFRELREVLKNAPSVGDWLIVEDFPQYALIVQPKNYAVLPNPGAALQFRSQISREISLVSRFIEQQLHINDSPSLGLDLRPKDLTLSGIEDHWEPHFRNIYLVREPDIFNPAMGATSEHDRLLHYGLTEGEAFALTQYARNQGHDLFRIIPRLYQPYKDQWVLPSELSVLREECLRIKENTSDAEVLRACEKILSICKSAGNYKLGIFIDSD